jgi:hypothetical protein
VAGENEEEDRDENLKISDLNLIMSNHLLTKAKEAAKTEITRFIKLHPNSFVHVEDLELRVAQLVACVSSEAFLKELEGFQKTLVEPAQDENEKEDKKEPEVAKDGKKLDEVKIEVDNWLQNRDRMVRNPGLPGGVESPSKDEKVEPSTPPPPKPKKKKLKFRLPFRDGKVQELVTFLDGIYEGPLTLKELFHTGELKQHQTLNSKP